MRWRFTPVSSRFHATPKISRTQKAELPSSPFEPWRVSEIKRESFVYWRERFTHFNTLVPLKTSTDHVFSFFSLKPKNNQLKLTENRKKIKSWHLRSLNQGIFRILAWKKWLKRLIKYQITSQLTFSQLSNWFSSAFNFIFIYFLVLWRVSWQKMRTRTNISTSEQGFFFLF